MHLLTDPSTKHSRSTHYIMCLQKGACLATLLSGSVANNYLFAPETAGVIFNVGGIHLQRRSKDG